MKEMMTLVTMSTEELPSLLNQQNNARLGANDLARHLEENDKYTLACGGVNLVILRSRNGEIDITDNNQFYKHFADSMDEIRGLREFIIHPSGKVQAINMQGNIVDFSFSPEEDIAAFRTQTSELLKASKGQKGKKKKK